MLVVGIPRLPYHNLQEACIDNKEYVYLRFVEFDGEYFKIRNAKFYTRPTGKIPLYMAAVGEHLRYSITLQLRKEKTPPLWRK
jgi:alkanesulfonate monooxygenase SsuD/methylene tetrahydromethanopterin reductase-like flavin-dependent oxidoreductase (luciferase family)